MRAGLYASLIIGWFIFVGGSEMPPPMLRFHVQASPKLGKEKVVPVTLVDPAAMIYIRKYPDLSERDIQSLDMLDKGRVLVTFNEAGRLRFEEMTRANSEIIMVVICNGRVIYAPLIDTVIGDGKLLLPKGISEDEIKELREVMGPKSTPLLDTTRGRVVGTKEQEEEGFLFFSKDFPENLLNFLN